MPVGLPVDESVYHVCVINGTIRKKAKLTIVTAGIFNVTMEKSVWSGLKTNKFEVCFGRPATCFIYSPYRHVSCRDKGRNPFN